MQGNQNLLTENQQNKRIVSFDADYPLAM